MPQPHGRSRPDGGIDRESPTTKVLFAVVAVASASVLALLLALSLFTHPSADDFCIAVKERLLGFAGAQTWWYTQWTGRYTASAAITAFASSADLLTHYGFAAMAILSLTYASFVVLIRSIARDRWSWRATLVVAAVVTVLFFSVTPDPAQTFYWLTGSLTYQLGNVLFVLLVALLVRRETRDDFALATFAVCALLVVGAVGSNEAMLLLTVSVLFACTFVAWRTRRPTRFFWSGLLVVAGLAALVSILAPGNEVRAASMHGDGQLRPEPWLAVLAYLPWTVLRILYWLSSFGLWASAFLLLWTTGSISRTLLYRNGAFDRRLLWIPIAWIAVLFLLSALGFAVNRYPLPERAESVVALAFVLGWYPSFIILAHFAFGARALEARRRQVELACVLLIIGILGTPAIFEAYKDVYRGYRYDREMQERFAILERHRGDAARDLTVASLSRPPRTLFATDFTTDPGNFRNSCASEYFGVRSIVLGAPVK